MQEKADASGTFNAPTFARPPEAAAVPLALSEGFHAGGLYVLGLLGLGLALAAGIVALSQQRKRAFSAALIYVLLGALAALAMSAWTCHRSTR